MHIFDYFVHILSISTPITSHYYVINRDFRLRKLKTLKLMCIDFFIKMMLNQWMKKMIQIYAQQKVKLNSSTILIAPCEFQ